MRAYDGDAFSDRLSRILKRLEPDDAQWLIEYIAEARARLLPPWIQRQRRLVHRDKLVLTALGFFGGSPYRLAAALREARRRPLPIDLPTASRGWLLREILTACGGSAITARAIFNIRSGNRG